MGGLKVGPRMCLPALQHTVDEGLGAARRGLAAAGRRRGARVRVRVRVRVRGRIAQIRAEDNVSLTPLVHGMGVRSMRGSVHGFPALGARKRCDRVA